MAFYDNITSWVGDHWVYLLCGALAIYFIYTFFFKDKKKFKQINRAEIERKNFIKRMEINYSDYKWLWRGAVLIGKINKFKMTILDLTKKESILEMVVTPMFLNLWFIRIPNPFAKKMCIMSGYHSARIDSILKEIVVLETISYDYYMGIYYDRDYKEKIVPYIVVDTQFRTDWDSFASIYYGKSQEQATFAPEHAIEIQKKQIELEMEKERRAKAVTGN